MRKAAMTLSALGLLASGCVEEQILDERQEYMNEGQPIVNTPIQTEPAIIETEETTEEPLTIEQYAEALSPLRFEQAEITRVFEEGYDLDYVLRMHEYFVESYDGFDIRWDLERERDPDYTAFLYRLQRWAEYWFDTTDEFRERLRQVYISLGIVEDQIERDLQREVPIGYLQQILDTEEIDNGISGSIGSIERAWKAGFDLNDETRAYASALAEIKGHKASFSELYNMRRLGRSIEFIRWVHDHYGLTAELPEEQTEETQERYVQAFYNVNYALNSEFSDENIRGLIGRGFTAQQIDAMDRPFGIDSEDNSNNSRDTTGRGLVESWNEVLEFVDELREAGFKLEQIANLCSEQQQVPSASYMLELREQGMEIDDLLRILEGRERIPARSYITQLLGMGLNSEQVSGLLRNGSMPPIPLIRSFIDSEVHINEYADFVRRYIQDAYPNPQIIRVLLEHGIKTEVMQEFFEKIPSSMTGTIFYSCRNMFQNMDAAYVQEVLDQGVDLQLLIDGHELFSELLLPPPELFKLMQDNRLRADDMRWLREFLRDRPQMGRLYRTFQQSDIEYIQGLIDLGYNIHEIGVFMTGENTIGLVSEIPLERIVAYNEVGIKNLRDIRILGNDNVIETAVPPEYAQRLRQIDNSILAQDIMFAYKLGMQENLEQQYNAARRIDVSIGSMTRVDDDVTLEVLDAVGREFKIRYFERYQKDVIMELYALANGENPYGNAVIVPMFTAYDDRNGVSLTMHERLQRFLDESYQARLAEDPDARRMVVIPYEILSDSGYIGRITDFNERFGPILDEILFGHGNSKGIRTGEQPFEQHEIDAGDDEEFSSTRTMYAEGARRYLLSCSTGEGEDPVAQHLANASDIEVVAPISRTNLSGARIDYSGETPRLTMECTAESRTFTPE